MSVEPVNPLPDPQIIVLQAPSAAGWDELWRWLLAAPVIGQQSERDGPADGKSSMEFEVGKQRNDG